MFTASHPLQFVAIDLSDELPRTPRANRFLLVIVDQFSKLTQNVPLRSLTAEVIPQAFLFLGAFIYGPPAKLLFATGTQLTSRFFTAICKQLEVETCFTTARHLQANSQMERYNRTWLSAIRISAADNQQD